MSRTFSRLFLLSIVCFFSLLAFRYIKDQGILYHDTGAYLLEAKFLQESARLVLTLPRSDYAQPGFWEKIKTSTSGVPLHLGKPGFNVLLCAGSIFLGFQDSLASCVTAFFAILGLCLTFLIAQKIGDTLSAIFSTALLASSTFYLVYARSGLADPIVTVFFLAGIYLYLLSVEGKAISLNYGAGLALGYAFSTNQWRSLYMVVLLLASDLLRVPRWGWKVSLRRTCLIIFGFLTPIVVFQIPYTIAHMVAGHLPFPDYWDQLHERFLTSNGLVWFKDIGEMGRSFWKVEGPFLPLLVVCGWGFLLIRYLRKRCWEDLTVLAFSLIPFLYFSAMTWGGAALPRTTSSLIPISCIAGGEMLRTLQRFLVEKFGFLKRGNIISAVVLVAAVLALSLPRSLAIIRTGSGYAQASRYLRATGEKTFIVLGMEPVWRFYLGRIAYQPYARPSTIQELLQRARSQGIRHVLVDFSTFNSIDCGEYSRMLARQVPPEAIFPNARGSSLAYLLDNYGLEKAEPISNDPLNSNIFIFSIKDIEKNLKP